MKLGRQGAPDIGMEAAEWLDQLENNPEADREAFQRWLARSPKHVEAVLNVTALDRVFDDLDPDREIDVRTFVAEAQRTVVPLQAALQPAGTLTSRGWTRRHFGFAALAATIVAAAGLTWMLLGASTYSTEIGEQRTLQLPDGSTVNLGARSILKLGFSDTARDVTLE